MRDYNIAVNNIRDAFAAIETDGGVLKWKRGTAAIQSGGHLQSIQRLRKGRGNNLFNYIISASGRNQSFFLVIEKRGAATKAQQDNPENVICIQPVLDKPYSHAGGIQMVGDVLVIGVEDDNIKDKSKVLFYNLNDAANPQKLAVEIDHAGEIKKSTAGAVGMVKRTQDHLVAVGSWDSDTIDFYVSNGKPLDDPDSAFEFHKRWDKESADRTGWIDDNWAKYQGLNLIAQPDGELFLIGFNRNAAGKDWADLYQLDTTVENEKMICKVDKLHVNCFDGASFRWGGGVFCIDDTRIALYASERDIHANTTYNQFWF